MNLLQRTIYKSMILGLKAYRWTFLSCRVWGRENIPEGPKIFAANHITSHEILLTTFFPEPVHVVVGPVCKYRLVAWLCKYLEQINAMPEHREASHRAGADAFLVKPLDAAELIAEVMEARDAGAQPGA